MFSLACNLTKNDVEFLPIQISSAKIRVNNMDSSTIKTTSKKVSGNKNVRELFLLETTWIFRPEKFHRKKCAETTRTFWPSKLYQKKYVVTTCIFRPSKLHQKKVRENVVDFSTMETTLKKYLEMTQKFFEIWPSTYRRNIDVESMWIQRGVPIGTTDITKSILYSDSLYLLHSRKRFAILIL